MISQNVLHSETIPFSAGKEKSIKLDVDKTYGEIRLFVKGTYTIGAGTLHGDFPKNIFRNVTLQRNNSDGIYAGKSKDIRTINYYDALGLEHFTASGGKFEALFRLNKAILLADPSVLPAGHDHPFKNITQLELKVTWGDDTEAFSVDSSSSLDDATCYVSYDQIQTTPQEIATIYGDSLEKYALPKVMAKQTDSKNSSTEFTECLNIGSSNLLKRGFIVTLDGSSVEKNDRIEKYQIKQKLPVEAERELITARFDNAQADDKSFYGLSSVLTGIVAVDYDAEVSQDGRGILVPEKEEALKLLAKIDNTTIFRYISEEYVVNRPHIASGGEVVLGI